MDLEIGVGEISSFELKDELESPNPPVLVDVREESELSISRIDPHVHIPLGSLPLRLKDLDFEANIVVMCRSGNRSLTAANYLVRRGFKRVRNLSDGINGWATHVDPRMQKY